jgi:hypothetical protein
VKCHGVLVRLVVSFVPSTGERTEQAPPPKTLRRKTMNPGLVLTLALAATMCMCPLASAQDAELPPTDAMAWVLGSKLGVAAAVQESGKNPEAAAKLMELSGVIASALGTTVPSLPERGTRTSAEYGADIMHYILKEVEPLAKELSEKHSKAHGLYFEMAIKIASLSIIYGPGDEVGLTVADVVQDRAKLLKLPEKLWLPLVTAIRDKKPYDDVIDQVIATHEAVRVHLMKGK